mmetsp:Transcript_38649/g.92459  ORF Transcript_38649/g.92459 Transcript_38649/m.92459 type:complete len:209 (-) Transcript_38649:1127-1753(-)
MVDFVPLLRIFPFGIVMKAHTLFRREEIVSYCEPSEPYAHFLALKDHGLVQIVWHSCNEMPSREGIACCPVWLQLWRASDVWYALWLRKMTQVLSLDTTLILCVTHDRPRISQALARGGYAPDHVGQIGRQDGHLIASRLHLIYDADVPVSDETHVRIRLCTVVLASIKPVAYVPSEDWPDGKFCVHLKDIDLIFVLAQRLLGVLRTR